MLLASEAARALSSVSGWCSGAGAAAVHQVPDGVPPLRNLRSRGTGDCPVTAIMVTRCDGRDSTDVQYPPDYGRQAGLRHDFLHGDRTGRSVRGLWARTGRPSPGSAWVESVVRRHADALSGMPTGRPGAWPYARRRLRPGRSVIDEASGLPSGAVRRCAGVAGTCGPTCPACPCAVPAWEDTGWVRIIEL